jgi:hypothetical protein
MLWRRQQPLRPEIPLGVVLGLLFAGGPLCPVARGARVS